MIALIRRKTRPSGRELVKRRGARFNLSGGGTIRSVTPARLALVLGLAMVVLLSGVGVLYQQARRAQLTAEARSDAAAAARSHAKEILSYDHRTLDHDIAQAKADTTGKLRRQYTNLTSKLVSPKAKKHNVVVRADVVGSAVVTASPERVVIVLFVNQTTRSDLLKGPRIDPNRVRMTLKEAGGKWLAADLVAL